LKESGLLKLLDRFSDMFRRAGVDYDMLRLILQLKLVMDSRRVPTVIANSGKVKEGKNYFKSSLFIYCFMGLFTALLIELPFPLFYKMNFSIGMIIFLLMSTMISDFSSVLLDVREKNILAPRPISPKTLSTAKAIHIVYYLFYITLALAGPSLVLGAISYGPVFLIIFLIEIILICAFVVFFTSILYTLILRFFDGEKLKDIINYFQIILSVVLLFSYQLIGRIFDISELVITTSPAWWHYIMPTAWFAAPFSLFLEHDLSAYNIYLSAAAFIMPILSLILYIRAVMPHFEKNLQKLNTQSSRNTEDKSIKAAIDGRIAKLLCSTDHERLFFRFTQLLSGNERKLKLRLYPTLAFSVFMPFVFMLNSLGRGKTAADFFDDISNGTYHLGLYFTAIMLGSTMQLLKNSENYRGAWIYRALPLESPVPVFKGALKGFLLRFIIPIYLFTSLIFVIICGIRIIPDVLLIFFNMMLLILLIYRFTKKELPFYKDFQYTQDGNTTGFIMLCFFITGLLGGAHYLMTLVPFGVTIYLAVSMLIDVLLWKSSFKIAWKDISY
jgi:hypothetical protein